MTDSPDTVSLNFPGGQAEFPIVPSVEGASSIDFSSLTQKTGYTSLDHGFANTAATSSGITLVDGEEGVLRYRGYSINDVAENSTFLEVAWL
ncbi:MAG TPA: citrate (Si)-synthase, partial [Microbacteriaceae bacterium]|nr:citrate (Si)-synthase [Microbacteriaceae bacterium]